VDRSPSDLATGVSVARLTPAAVFFVQRRDASARSMTPKSEVDRYQACSGVRLHRAIPMSDFWFRHRPPRHAERALEKIRSAAPDMVALADPLAFPANFSEGRAWSTTIERRASGWRHSITYVA
jgi:hypothetical protein